MELEIAKQVIQKYAELRSSYVAGALIAKRYYENESDILFGEKKTEVRPGEEEKPLRNADNRIPRNFHGLLVNQKASYAFTVPPTFDVGSTAANQKITELLGDEYNKNCMELCVNAANAKCGWVHYWNDADGFAWAVVPSEQIWPVFDKSLKQRLMAVLRIYEQVDESDGENYVIYEYWNDTECQAFRRRTVDSIEHGLMYYNMFHSPTAYGDPSSEFQHGFGKVPFIPFWNNNIHMSDLKNIKPLIDVYDKVFSGFINDLDDVQELIFVLSGYGGEDLQEFLQNLKRYKAIKLDDDGSGSPGVSTISIEIPIEARNSVLEATRKAIFEQGFGFDPRPETFGNQSGVALQFMYALLEMKTGLMETEFRLGFAQLVRAICENNGIPCGTITQNWTRTMIRNDVEQAQICQQSVGVISKKTILKNHPFVENADEELKQLKKEEAEAKEAQDQYLSAFVKQKGGTVDGSQDPEEMKDPEGKKEPEENQDPDSKKATGRQKPDKGGTDA
jgi:SPP1 family phage portal protein